MDITIGDKKGKSPKASTLFVLFVFFFDL